jgi:hypothetical protein
MKHSLMLSSILATLGLASIQADDVLPPRFNFDRYSAMVNHSPFAIATAVALPSATPDFAKDLYVANAARSPEGDMVTIASSSDQNFKEYLTTKNPVDGYGIANIEWSDRVGATKVTISKDGKFATVTFNEALLSQQAPNTSPELAVPSPQNATVALPPPLVPPSPRQLRQMPRPHVRGQIQRQPRPVPVPARALPTPQLEPTPQEEQ